jgi:hypothetical protein
LSLGSPHRPVRAALHCCKSDRLPPVPKQVTSATTRRRITDKLAKGLYIVNDTK